MAQATHGSAPDISGKGIANPFAMIKSAQMMLDWLGRRHQDPVALKAAEDIEWALEKVLEDKASVTPDLGGTASTTQMGEAVCRLIRER